MTRKTIQLKNCPYIPLPEGDIKVKLDEDIANVKIEHIHNDNSSYSSLLKPSENEMIAVANYNTGCFDYIDRTTIDIGVETNRRINPKKLGFEYYNRIVEVCRTELDDPDIKPLSNMDFGDVWNHSSELQTIDLCSRMPNQSHFAKKKIRYPDHEKIKVIIDKLEKGIETELHLALFLDAQTKLRTGEYKEAILFSQLSLEVLVDQGLMKKYPQYSDCDDLKKNENLLDMKKRVKKFFNSLDTNFANTSLYQKWYSGNNKRSAYQIRNKVAHGGYKPSYDEANFVVETIESIIKLTRHV